MDTSLNNWQSANSAAVTQGGHLASITSKKENQWISGRFGAYSTNSDYYWLGGSDTTTEGIWEWANGEPWAYSNWQSGEPNDALGAEDALTWYNQGSTNADGLTWNDRDPSQPRYVLATFDSNPVPEPSTLGLMGLGIAGINLTKG